ncbi:MAG TPA: S1/P1 nuclease [Longimicrobium sp.]|jgi:hypothetical protein|nr:S1/P1 nuclease [Longimicrobium sp.]
MKLGRVGAAALVALGLGARPAYAWDELGHRVVARIAWDHLTPQARTAAVRLLMNAPANSGIPALASDATEAERGRELFVMAAVWPDIIRSSSYVGNRYAHSNWHYVNFFWAQQLPGGPPIDRPDKGTDGELLNQLPRLAATLAAPAAGDSARSLALAWILHLVGDAHQPLHNSARITPQDPQGDRGGNLFLLGGMYPRSNLHGYWDAVTGFSAPWRTGDRTEADYVGYVSAGLARRYTPAWARGRLLPGRFEQWSREGLAVAERTIYPAWLVRGQPAPARYQPVAWTAAQPRLALAGYRIAELLNRTLGG